MGGAACPTDNGPQQPSKSNEALKAELGALDSVLSAGQRDTARALQLLDSLIQAANRGRMEDIGTGSLVEACLTCSRAVHPVEWGPTVSLKALESLATLLHLCKQEERDRGGISQCPTGPDAITLAQQVARALQADTDGTTVSAGLSALHALAACFSAGGAQAQWGAGGLLDAVGDAGVVEAAAVALQRLALLPGQLPDDAQQPQQAQQRHAVQGLEVLHCVCYGHEANLQRLVTAGGLPSVAAATALTVHPAGLALMGQVASRQAAQHAERQLAARALLAAAQRAQPVPQLQSIALQGLYGLLAAGSAGACDTPVLPAEDVVGGILPLLQGGREPAEPGALTAHVYCLAAIGTVAPALSEPLPGPVLDMLQAALAQMAALLGKSPPGAVRLEGMTLGMPDGEAAQQAQHSEQAPQAQQADVVEWDVLRAAVGGLVALLGASGPEGVNTPDRDGFTLLHRLATAGIPQALGLLLATPCSPALDLLVRTRDGANALQLASKSGHAGCVAALEGPTQAAAQRVMDALLAELDQEAGEGKARGVGGGAAGGGKKKKPGEKASTNSRPGSGQGTSSLDAAGEAREEDVAADADAADVETSVQHANGLTEDQRRRRKELEDAYERALEARRQELEHQAAQRAQQQQQAQQTQPGSAAPTPSSSQAGSPSSRAAGGGGGGGADFQPPASPQPQEGGPMLSAFASTGSSGPLDYPTVSFNTTPPAQSPLVSAFAAGAALKHASGNGGAVAGQSVNSPGAADRQTAFSIAGVDLSHTLASSRGLLGGAGGSSGAAAPLQMAPALSGDLQGQLSLGAQQFQQAPVLVGSPPPAPASAFAAAGGAFPSALQHQGSLTALGAPQLSGSLEQASAFAQLATAGSGLAGATPFAAAQHAQQQHQLGSVLPYPGDAAMHAGAAALQAARSFSSHLQDAMFYAGGDGPGSPQTSSAAAVAARNALAAAAVNNLAARAASLPLQLSGRAGSAADEILNLLPMVGGAAANPAAAAAALEGLARQHSQAWAQGLADGLTDDRNKTSDPDVSGEPTRHLWIGNLGTRTPRAVLKTIFEKYGVVDDVVTFPGRMYAFVNYRSLDEAMAAYQTLQGQVVPELTGDRPLLLKFRPAKKAAAHLRALGLAADDGSALPGGAEGAGAAAPGGAGGALGAAGSDAERLFGAGGSGGAPGAGVGGGGDVDKDGNSLEPSPRIWLGNIAPTATSKSLHAVLSRFGALTDAAVFPARIGPLGYAFVKFERLEDAVRAFEALNNTVVPPLSGSKQLKMRYKPPSDGPPGKDDLADGSKVMVPSRHLWLGNVTQKPTDEQVLEVFQAFGQVDSVRVFPVKAYAFVNYAEIASAIKAMSSLEGVAIPALTGVKPLVMRYQQEAVVAAAAAASAVGAKPLGLPPPCPLSRAASDVGLTFGGASAQQLLSAASSLLPPLLGTPEDAVLHQAAADDAAAAAAVASLQSVPNLSNRLNPNNVHFDPELAERYKALSRREKDMLWATDQLMAAHQLAAQQQAVAAAAQGGAGAAGDGSLPAPEMLSLLNRGMNRSHSWNISMLHSHMQQHPNQPASGLSPALAAAAALAAAQHQQQQHAAAVHQSHMATLRLLNNPSGEGPAFPPMSQPQHAGHDMAGLLHQQSQHAQHAQAAQHAQQAPSPTATASPAQLSAVLSNLAALQSMHAASGGPVAAAAGAGLAASMQRAASMPVAGGHMLPVSRFGALESSALVSPYLNGGQAEHAQHDVLAGLIQMPAAGSPTHDSGNGMGGPAAVSPDAQLDMTRQLSSMLAKQSLGAGASPAHSPMPGHSLGMVMGASPAASSLPMSPPGLPLGRAPAAPGSPLQMQPGHSAFAAAAGGAGAGALPDQLLCPLSGQVMLEPVVAADGVTYERRAISDWLAVRDISPVTQSPLPHKMLTPSLAGKAALMDFLQRSHLGVLLGAFDLAAVAVQAADKIHSITAGARERAQQQPQQTVPQHGDYLLRLAYNELMGSLYELRMALTRSRDATLRRSPEFCRLKKDMAWWLTEQPQVVVGFVRSISEQLAETGSADRPDSWRRIALAALQDLGLLASAHPSVVNRLQRDAEEVARVFGKFTGAQGEQQLMAGRKAL
ncbi:hypothetical protein N2152v2_008670 [Parachlorella kessleri]